MKRFICTLAVIFALLPLSAAADSLPKPTTEISTPLYKLTKVEPLPAPTVAEVATVEEIPVPAPEPVYTPPVQSTAPAVDYGCTSYMSGDYYLDKIIAYESGGNSCATNPGGCFGLLQACPGEPLRAACGGSPACQIEWFIQNKTGGRSWQQVWEHEEAYGWW